MHKINDQHIQLTWTVAACAIHSYYIICNFRECCHIIACCKCQLGILYRCTSGYHCAYSIWKWNANNGERRSISVRLIYTGFWGLWLHAWTTRPHDSCGSSKAPVGVDWALAGLSSLSTIKTRTMIGLHLGAGPMTHSTQQSSKHGPTQTKIRDLDSDD